MNDIGRILELRMLAEQVKYLRDNDFGGVYAEMIRKTKDAYTRKADEIGAEEE